MIIGTVNFLTVDFSILRDIVHKILKKDRVADTDKDTDKDTPKDDSDDSKPLTTLRKKCSFEFLEAGSSSAFTNSPLKRRRLSRKTQSSP